MSRRWFIYVLEDPDTTEVRYVGVTHGRNRLREHIYGARSGRERNHRACWVRALLRKGRRPVQRIVEEGVGPLWAQSEQTWIARLIAAGARLTNATSGGEGTVGRKLSRQHREKLSEAGRRRKGARLSPEARENMRRARNRRVQWEKEQGIKRTMPPRSAETRRRMSEAQIGRKASDLTRVKLSDAHRNPSKETRQKLRDAVLSRPVEQRAQFATNQRGVPKSPEHRSKIAEALKKAWARKKGVHNSPHSSVEEDQ